MGQIIAKKKIERVGLNKKAISARCKNRPAANFG